MVREAIIDIVRFMNEAEEAHKAEHFPSLAPSIYYVDGGRKYVRIASAMSLGAGGHVHCFIDAETGSVYKAASWKKPALNGERFNLLDKDSVEDLKSKWDPYGSYLYK